MPNYYSCRRALSYGTPFIFSLGNRSIGKTFSYTSLCVNNFLKKGTKFVYMRRYDEDLKISGATFLDEMRRKYPDVAFDVKGSGKSGTLYYINNMIAGMTVSLSKGFKYKSMVMSDYDIIFFDEFLNEDGVYLPEEVSKCLNFYQSVARGYGRPIREEVRFIFCGNHVTINNPYFRELKIRDHIKLGTRYCVDPDRAWVVEMTDNQEIASEITKTPFGKMIAKTKYGEMAVKSQFYLDDDTFIQKPKGKSEYYCTLIYNDKAYGVYEYTELGLFFISKKANTNYPVTFSLTTKDHKPNYLLMFKQRNNPVFTMLKYAYEIAMLRFDSDESKFMFMDFMTHANAY